MALKDHFGAIAVGLGSALAIAGLSSLASRRNQSLSEMEEGGDEGDGVDEAVKEYLRVASTMKDMVPTDSEDINVILSETQLDLAHDDVKRKIRNLNPLIANAQVDEDDFSYGYDSYMGMPKGEIDRWNDPSFRFLIYLNAARQARALHDKLRRIRPKMFVLEELANVPGGVPKDIPIAFFHPHENTLRPFSEAALMAAMAANMEVQNGARTPQGILRSNEVLAERMERLTSGYEDAQSRKQQALEEEIAMLDTQLDLPFEEAPPSYRQISLPFKER